eukprot:jgi/Ulvmu1/3661/UM017_0075.1
MVLARASKSQDEVVKAILPVVDPTAAEKATLNSDAKETRGFLSPETAASPLVSGSVYCVVSAAMVLLNKYALSGFDFSSPNTLLLFQCVSSVLFVKVSELLGVWRVEKLRWDVVRIWLPVNILFVLMLSSGIWALQLLGVGMVTIMKNLTNLLTISGDYFMYGRTYNVYVWLSLSLIMGSALVGASTDLAFTWWGYTAQILNCVFTAGYSLVLRGVMDKVKTVLGEKMPTHSQVYYNNLLSIPFVIALVVVFGEPQKLMQDAALARPAFQAVAVLSCVVGFYISYATLWFLSTTTPTTYGLVGSLNKIPVAIIGIIMFSAPTTRTNLISIGVGLAAGVMFVKAKQY